MKSSLKQSIDFNDSEREIAKQMMRGNAQPACNNHSLYNIATYKFSKSRIPKPQTSQTDGEVDMSEQHNSKVLRPKKRKFLRKNANNLAYSKK